LLFPLRLHPLSRPDSPGLVRMAMAAREHPGSLGLRGVASIAVVDGLTIVAGS
jgi:hypothetical protein